ncbi:TPA: hypothetical protein DF272_04450 [Candidatus Falkowbacteria bacterium]|nr:hypothetical protein [Candidatus Falkowbacteria bacterium]
MNISWHGQSCFRISEKIDGKEVVLVTDPYSKESGLFPQKFEADIVTVSHHHFDHNYTEKISGNQDEQPVIFDRPGEYEVKQVFITGIASFHDKKGGAENGDNTIFRINFGDITLVHLGDLGVVLDEKQLDELGTVDILFVPVGGKYTLDGIAAAEVVRQIEPRMVIPMHYKIAGLKIEVGDEKKFLKEMGDRFDSESKLKIAFKDLPEDMTRVVVLEKS